jgi:uncharacterized HAD superfamily protein
MMKSEFIELINKAISINDIITAQITKDTGITKSTLDKWAAGEDLPDTEDNMIRVINDITKSIIELIIGKSDE